MRLNIKEYSSEAQAFEYIGSFVLPDGAKKIEIDVPPAGLKYMQEMLAERVYGRDENGKRTKLVTSDENPEEWMRGWAAEYHSMYVHAAIEGDSDRPDGGADGWEEPAVE